MSVVFEAFAPVYTDDISLKGRRGSALILDATGLNYVRARGRRGEVRVTEPAPPQHVSLRGRRGFARVDNVTNVVFGRGRHGRVAVSQFEAPPISLVQSYGRRGTAAVSGTYSEHYEVSVNGRRGRLLATNIANAVFGRGRRGRMSVSDYAFLSRPFAMLLQGPGYLYMLNPEDANHKFLFDRMAFQAETPSAQAVLQLLDSIVFGGGPSQTVNLHAAIAASLAFGSNLLGGAGGILADTVQFADDAVALVVMVATLLDSFAVSAELTGSAALFAFLSDAFEFNDSINVRQQILQALSDGIEFGMTLYTGADTYTAWVMTPETRAMRSYSNYAFNSYANFGGRLYGAKDDGVYLLEGDTDAGQEIHASVRTGLLDFGSRQLKRITRAYLGYTADGTLALRVTTTSPEGKKVDYTYRMVTPPQADAPRETRVIIGRGLQSVYWAFELDNSIDGGDFELHDVTVLPMILSRKVR